MKRKFKKEDLFNSKKEVFVFDIYGSGCEIDFNVNIVHISIFVDDVNKTEVNSNVHLSKYANKHNNSNVLRFEVQDALNKSVYVVVSSNENFECFDSVKITEI
jgi:hypothetical protein